jgi:hypothetical protein
MLTGQLPSIHEAHAHSQDFEQIRKSNTFLSDLPDHSTIGVSTNAFAGYNFGFDRFFDNFTEVPHNSFYLNKGVAPSDFKQISNIGYITEAIKSDNTTHSLLNGILAKSNISDFLGNHGKVSDNGTARSLQLAKSHIENTESRTNPVFVFMNIMEAHSPMYAHYKYDNTIHNVPSSWTSVCGPKNREVSYDTDTHQEYIDNWTELYGASIDYLDRKITNWIEIINKITKKETTIIITSDHGQNLAKSRHERLFGHQSSLHEAILNVPLIIINPPEGYESRVDRLVSHLELGALVTSLAKGNTYKFSDNTVTAEIVGTIKTYKDNLTYWDRAIRCSYQNEAEKLVWDSLGNTKLYEINGDNTQQEMRMTQDRITDDDSILFESKIADMKRNALNRGLSTSGQKFTDSIQSRLSNLGYT